jgi:hypothetical protein
MPQKSVLSVQSSAGGVAELSNLLIGARCRCSDASRSVSRDARRGTAARFGNVSVRREND